MNKRTGVDFVGLLDKLLGPLNLSWSGSYSDYYNNEDSDEVENNIEPNQLSTKAQEDYSSMRLKEIQWLESHYDFNSEEGISAIPVSANLPRLDNGKGGLRTYTGDVDYYLRLKAFEYEKQGNIELAILCLKKSNDIRMIARKGYRRNDYYSLVRMLARSGQISEAEAEKQRIDNLFSENPGWDNDSLLLMPQHMVKHVIDSANALHTDLVIMNAHENACSECAKYQGRVFSLYGEDNRFPKIPESFWKYGVIHPGCGHSFHPFIYGISDPDLACTLKIQRGVKWKYTRNIISYSNRPFIDDRPRQDIDAALAFTEKRREEADRQKYRWDHLIETEAAKGAAQREFKWVQEHLPDLCPKSISGYRRMKAQNSKNFQKIVAAAKTLGVEL